MRIGRSAIPALTAAALLLAAGCSHRAASAAAPGSGTESAGGASLRMMETDTGTCRGSTQIAASLRMMETEQAENAFRRTGETESPEEEAGPAVETEPGEETLRPMALTQNEEEGASAGEEVADHLNTAFFRYEPFDEDTAWNLLARYAGDADRRGSLSLADGSIGLWYSRHRETDAQSRYSNLLLTAAVWSDMSGTGALFEGAGDIGRRSQLAALDPGNELSEKALTARENAAGFLEELGYQLAYMDVCELSPENLLELGGFEKELFGKSEWMMLQPEEEEGILLVLARQKAGEVTVERYCDEACLKLVVSLKDGAILSAEFLLPPCMQAPAAEEETVLIPAEEAVDIALKRLEQRGMTELSGESTGKSRFGTGLVYAMDMLISPFSAGDQTVTLIPAWKVTFPVTVGDEVIEEYILIDARAGRQLNNAVPLSYTSPSGMRSTLQPAPARV